jgi:hypothetical protein
VGGATGLLEPSHLERHKTGIQHLVPDMFHVKHPTNPHGVKA